MQTLERAVYQKRQQGGPGRIRLSQVADYSATNLHAFLAVNVASGATAKAPISPH